MTPPHIVVVGNGMVGQRFVEELVERGADAPPRITVVGAERRGAYDRVGLSRLFEGATPADLALGDPASLLHAGVDLRLGEEVVRIDTGARVVETSTSSIAYDHLVLATGSTPFVPPLAGRELPGVFVYRTIDDLLAIQGWVASRAASNGIVVGGGLLGLEAANALRLLGLTTHVVEMADRLMPMQLDLDAARVLERRIAALGIEVHTSVSTDHLRAGADGDIEALVAVDGTVIATDIVVFSAGIRPCDQLAAEAGLVLGERGGVVVDDRLITSDPDVSAIGEVAAVAGRTLGLVAPGYEMARVAADRVLGGNARFSAPDLSTKLKLMGVGVASFGDAFATGAQALALVHSDPLTGVHRRLVVDSSTGSVTGGMLVGDVEGYELFAMMARGELDTPSDLSSMLRPAGAAEPPRTSSALPDGAQICSCNNVVAGTIRAAIIEGAATVGEVGRGTKAGTTCGGCGPLIEQLVTSTRQAAGLAVSNHLCGHFDHSRRELFELVRSHRHGSFAEVLAAHGQGGGCEVCRPTVASILASIEPGYVLDAERAALADTNDHVLANLQRNGTYSVVPRVPGGEITPAQLIALGQIALDFGLYTKITGGQRVDLLGARLDDLPDIWSRVLDAGMESGHAYGKAVRTVKSCVGSTWCRYGVQDSVAMAIRIELRYRGLRAPHKIKMAVSGCARECAEAQSKDVGVIATERGWNLYVGGNGGARPRHAELLATELDDDGLIQAIDRFLMFYVRSADKLERTATWLERFDGGLARLRAVVLDDELAIGAELEAEMQRHVDGYECEWRATLTDPERRKRFVSFVNAPDRRDPDIVMASERGQPRPVALAAETPVALAR